MDEPNFYITEENYKTLTGSGYWSIQDLPPARAEQVRSFLNNTDTLGVFASGIAPQLVSGYSNQIAGIDWVRLESKPEAGEPPLNVYHFVIMKPIESGYPVYACKEGHSIAKHWSELSDLHVYWNQASSGVGK